MILICGVGLATLPISANAATVSNACGVPVHHALIEVGRQTPPQVFTPEERNGRIEFNFLATATDPLTALCFRTADEASLFRMPLPEGLTYCHFAEEALSCSGDTVIAAPVPTEPLSTASLPPLVAQAFLAWNEECGTTSEAVFSEDYLTVVDIDHDGDEDYILNGDGATCIANGKVVARGGGNGGTSLKIFTRQGKTVTAALDIFTQHAEIRAHLDFATVMTPEGSYRVVSGRATKIKQSKNGTVVYTLGR